MNIQPLKIDALAVPAKSKAPLPARVPQPEVQPDPTQVARKEQLLEKLKSQSEVRPEVLERAKAIVADTTYPSHELMSRLTRIFLEK